MGSAGWSSASLNASVSGSTVSFTLSGTAYEYTMVSGDGYKEWSFYLFKDGSSTGVQITGWSWSGWSAVFSSKTFTYALGSGDFGKSITFSVVGYCTIHPPSASGESPWTETTDGNPSKSISTSTPSISWQSGASVTATPTQDLKVVVTRTKAATIGGGFSGTVYYRVWCENTRKNNDGDTGSSWTVTPNSYDVELTYKVQAYAVIGGTTYTTSTLTAKATVVTGNYIEYFNGTQWVKCKAFYYNGSNWVECKPYYYDGSRWIEISS